jgi:hypothetical protein
MGFMSRSCSIVRYRVHGEIEGPFWDAVDEGVRKGTFRDVDSDGDIVGMGWTSMEDFTDTSFEAASYARGSYVALAFRVDTVRIPAKMVEARFKIESRAILKESGRKRLTSSQGRELKEKIKADLRKQGLPSIQVSDLVWNVADHVLYFCNLGLRTRERMEDHFRACFGLGLRPLVPFLRAVEMMKDEAGVALLDGIQPCIMAP